MTRDGVHIVAIMVLAVLAGVVAPQSCVRELPDPTPFVLIENGEPDNPQTPEQQQNPEQPTEPEQQQNSEQPTEPEQPQTPEQPEEPQTKVDTVIITDEAFRAWILWFFDADKDGALISTEAEAITKIELNSVEIKSLDGIQFFPNLVHLHVQGERKDGKNLGLLTELDLSANKKLEHIHLIHNNIRSIVLGDKPHLGYLDLDYNELTELDVKSCPKLSLLQFSYNKVKKIDVSGLDGLEELDCDDNPLEEIILANPNLETLRCEKALIKELDLSKCPKANNVVCTSCPNLTTIRLAKGQKIGQLKHDNTAKIVYNE